MINSVSGFISASIHHASPSVQRGANAVAQQAPALITPSASVFTVSESLHASFADKLPTFFSLAPSDFAAIFSDVSVPATMSIFPQMVSEAYTQSTLLTAGRLSISV